MTEGEDLKTAIRRSPFHRLLDIDLVTADDDATVRIGLDIRQDHWRSDSGDGLHGGVIASLIDVAAIYAVLRVAKGRNAMTVSLSIDYLRSVTGPRAEAQARVVRAGRTQALSDVELFDGSVVAAVGRARFAMQEAS